MAIIYIILCIISLALIVLAHIFGRNLNKHLSTLLKIVSICLFIEIAIFNINSLHLFGNYNHRELDLSSANITNYDINSGEATGECTFEFTDLEEPVGTLTINASSDTRSEIKVLVDVKDATHSGEYYENIATVEIINGNARTCTTPLNVSGDVKGLQVRIYPHDDEVIKIDSIEINKSIAIHFSIVRFIIMLFVGASIYALSSREILNKQYVEVKGLTNLLAWIMVVLLIMFSLFITNAPRYRDEEHSLKKDFHSEGGNQITQELVDMFEAHRVDLDIPMNENLINLDNPYDWSQRTGDVGDYPWDHLLFEGKYYSYYGIGPVLTLFLPYHAITGYYFPGNWAVWGYTVLGIIFLAKLYLQLMYHQFKNVSASLILIGFAIIELSSSCMLNLYSGNFYEIAQSSAFCFVTIGGYFLIKSNVLGISKTKNVYMALSSVFLSIAVLCRATTAIYCVAALGFIFLGFLKNKSFNNYTNKNNIIYLVSALLPYALIGGIQVWYNIARFGNPLEFGIKYSLTISDFTSSQFHTHFVIITLFNYLFALPEFGEHFPFFWAGWAKTFNPNGYYFIATGAALGLFWRALPMATYFKAKEAYKVCTNKNKILYSALLAFTCFVCPVIIMFSSWQSGFASRYSCDFSWEMVIGSLIILFVLWKNSQDNTKDHMVNLMIAVGFISFVMNFVQIYSYTPIYDYSLDLQSTILSFGRLFEFWH